MQGVFAKLTHGSAASCAWPWIVVAATALVVLAIRISVWTGWLQRDWCSWALSSGAVVAILAVSSWYECR